ncbi:long-chain-fatty-acid--CoA ligase [Conexibacter woesei]|uniref:AMP-dependent synthetase and ligase n=1 Tax=Conexibacter woesei (strain DSM 14684 / CCUG 47730 / CIP 108061 / JCM 11494 / NBRC 100937 / ID131577) TaxID=469383 RepID=D3EYX7_CONWI|nr:long-chain fatty acid--CoA ligase [Conexibacter woesei]ADB49851.1 AMP-dependent synthetase and ligase [Conexibacter woesei DSM 14684]
MLENLAATMLASAAERPDAAAVRHGDRVISYAELAALSARFAARLVERGVRPGDRVGLMLPNVLQFPVAYLGILRAGAIVVPMNPLLRDEVRYYLSDSGARVLCAAPADGPAGDVGVAAAAAGAELLLADDAMLEGDAPGADVTDVERAGSDTAVILYTSGTTGKPKGAELSHDNLRRNAEICARSLLRLTPGDVVFGALPLFHSIGQTAAMNAGFAAGSELTLTPRFEPAAALALIEAHGATVFIGVPTMYVGLLAAAGERPAGSVASSLRLCVSGGASLPAEVLRRFEQRFEATILEGYGLSETSPVASFNHLEGLRKPGSIGTPIEGVSIRLLDGDSDPVAQGDVGEIAIKGHNVMKGYWQRPQETAAAMRDGWFLSGDLARVDEDGYYFIVDRKKDLIIRGGLNVYPREVEEVLYTHPAVAEACVRAIPDERLGEEIGAAVVLRDGHAAGEQELAAYVKARLAPYKYPRVIWFADALPKNATGKILRREVQLPASVAQQRASASAG